MRSLYWTEQNSHYYYYKLFRSGSKMHACCEHKFCMIIAVFNLQHRTKPVWHVYTGHRKSERQSGRVQVISEHFSRLYISCIYYLSCIRCIGLSYAAVTRFIVVTVTISSARSVQTTMQNINDYDWDCHMHTIIMRTHYNKMLWLFLV